MELLLTGRLKNIAQYFLDELKTNNKVVMASDDISADKISSETIKFDASPVDDEYEKIYHSYNIDTTIYFSQRPEEQDGYFNELQDLERVLQQCYNHDINNVIYITSTSIFAGQESIIDSGEPQPVNGVGVVLRACENLCEFYRKQYNLSILIIRTPSLYEVGEDTSLIGKLVRQAVDTGRVRLPGAENQACEYLSQRDLAFLINRILDNWSESCLVMNLPGSGGIKFRDLGELLKAYISDLEIEYNKNFAIIAQPLQSTQARRLYDWVPIHYLPEELPQIIDYMNNSSTKKKRGIRKVLGIKLSQNVVIRFIEIFIGFLLLEYLNYITRTTIFFQVVDFRMLYVLLLGTTHGLRVGLAAAAFACISCLIGYYRLGTDWRVIIYNIDNWLPFACYLLVGAVTGFIKDKKESRIKFVEKEYENLEERYIFLNELYLRALENKGQFKSQIMSYRDSFGRIFEVTKKLDSTVPDAVFKEALTTMEDILENQSICIYTVDNNINFGRLIVCSKQMNATTSKTLAMSELQLMISNLVPGEVWSNIERLANYPEYAAPIFQGEQLVALVTIQSVRFEQLAMYYENLIKILCGLMQASLLRAIEYNSVQDSKIYISGTSIMKKESFKEILDIKREMEAAAISEFSILKIDIEHRDMIEKGNAVAQQLRATDVIGIGSDDGLYVVLSQTNKDNIIYVLNRLEKSGVKFRQITQKAMV